MLTLAQELERYGIRINALSPGALTRMTDGLFDVDAADAWSPRNVSPAVAWLLGPAAAEITGTVLEVENGWLGFAHPWSHGPRVRRDAGQGVWTVDDVSAATPALIADYRKLADETKMAAE